MHNSTPQGVRNPPRRYGHLAAKVHLAFFELQTNITRHRNRVRSPPRSYGHLQAKVHFSLSFKHAELDPAIELETLFDRYGHLQVKVHLFF